MTMNERDILEALQTGLTAAVAASTASALPIKYILRNFVTPDDGKYIECVSIPNNVVGGTWGAERHYRGIFRLILHWPNDDVGAYPPMMVLQSIADYFAKGKRLTAGTAALQIYENTELVSVIEKTPENLFVASVWYMSFQP